MRLKGYLLEIIKDYHNILIKYLYIKCSHKLLEIRGERRQKGWRNLKKEKDLTVIDFVVLGLSCLLCLFILIIVLIIVFFYPDFEQRRIWIYFSCHGWRGLFLFAYFYLIVSFFHMFDYDSNEVFYEFYVRVLCFAFRRYLLAIDVGNLRSH